MTNVNNNINCKDKFIDGLSSLRIKQKLLEDEVRDETLNDLMTRAVNLESIYKNLSKPHSSASAPSTDGVEPMKI